MLIIDKPAFKKRTKILDAYGMVYHTSGRGIVERAIKNDKTVIELALDWYRKKGSVHAVIDYDGTIYQMLPWDRQGAHVGIGFVQRRKYLNGSWKKQVSHEAIAEWQERWPGVSSPQHLYPTKSPNQAFIGIEFLPLRRRDPKTKLWFTEEQHEAGRELWEMQRELWQWDENRATALLGHEDLSITRWDDAGGWDPGAMRDNPRFDWSRIIRC